MFLRFRPNATAAARLTRTTALPRTQVRFATQDYGSGDGHPAGEDPQKQGANPSESLEHPGPPPPKVAKGKSGSSPNESTGEQQSKQSQSQSQSHSNDGANKSTKGAKPKILNENPPTAKEQSRDVKEHNAEMEQRAEKAYEQVSNEDAAKDKVSKGFWAGQGGRDREP